MSPSLFNQLSKLAGHVDAIKAQGLDVMAFGVPVRMDMTLRGYEGVASARNPGGG